ncbi:MAG: Hint domain-containing protein [Paracoccaceae bacterium]
MPTSWNAIYLGQLTVVDPTEGNTTAENASSILGTYGSATDQIFEEEVLVTTTNVGGSPGQLEQDNSVAGDTVTYDLGEGAGPVTTTFDSVVQYTGTLTYTDGTTWTGTLNVIQDEFGNTFLVPNTANNAAQAALIAKPIQSVTLTTVSTSTNSGLQANRQTTDFLACFAAGTRVLTPTGERAVETLRTGDLVVTLDHGAQPIRWIGRTETLGRGNHTPIRIAAGALGNLAELRVSPQHRMLITGGSAELQFGEPEVLVAARHLVGQPGISEAPCGPVSYVHILLDRHELVLAEGAWAESFFPGDMLEQGDPQARAEIMALFPDLALPGSSQFQAARRVLKSAEAAALLYRPKSHPVAA